MMYENITPLHSELLHKFPDYYNYGNIHKSPERDPPSNVVSPITYTSLQPWHLDQVHDLLDRAFWSGIDGEVSAASTMINYAESDDVD